MRRGVKRHGHVVGREEGGLLVLHERRGEGRVRERRVDGGALEAGALAQHEQLGHALVRDRDHGVDRELGGCAAADLAEVVLGARHGRERGAHLLEVLAEPPTSAVSVPAWRARCCPRPARRRSRRRARRTCSRARARPSDRSCPCRPAPSPASIAASASAPTDLATVPSASIMITTSAPCGGTGGRRRDAHAGVGAPAGLAVAAVPDGRQQAGLAPGSAPSAPPMRPSPRKATFMRPRPRRACRSRCPGERDEPARHDLAERDQPAEDGMGELGGVQHLDGRGEILVAHVRERRLDVDLADRRREEVERDRLGLQADDQDGAAALGGCDRDSGRARHARGLEHDVGAVAGDGADRLDRVLAARVARCARRRARVRLRAARRRCRPRSATPAPEPAAAPTRNEPMPPAPSTATDCPGCAPLRRSACSATASGCAIAAASSEHVSGTSRQSAAGVHDVGRQAAVAVQAERVVPRAQVRASAPAPFARAARDSRAADDAVAECEAGGVRAERDYAAGELVAHDRRPLVAAEGVGCGDREELRGVRELGGVGAADRGARDLEHDIGARWIAGLGHVFDPYVARRVVDGGDHRRSVVLFTETYTRPKSTSWLYAAVNRVQRGWTGISAARPHLTSGVQDG